MLTPSSKQLIKKIKLLYPTESDTNSNINSDAQLELSLIFYNYRHKKLFIQNNDLYNQLPDTADNFDIILEYNDTEAFKWMLASANKKNPEAQYYMAIFNQFSIGTHRNLYITFEYFKLSAEKGFVEAQYQLAKCYDTDTILDWGCEKNINTALYWYYKASDSGHLYATLEIANYHFGLNTEPDMFIAYKIYKIIEQKNMMAYSKIKNLDCTFPDFKYLYESPENVLK